MIKQLWTCVILCLLSVGAFAQGSGPKTFNLTAASQCATITTDPKSTSGVYIQVSGTWSATLQAEVGVGGNPPVNVAVTPTTSQTQQSNITANGGYNAAVAGPDLFQLCVSSYVSGTAVVWLSATTGVASNALSGGGGGGGGSGTVTTVNSGTGLTGGPISVSGTLSIANTAVTPGSYTSTNLTVNQQGQITAATSGTGSGDTVTSPNSTISVGGSSSATTIDLAGSAGEIMAGATPALTSTPTFGQSGTAGTLSLFPASGNFTSKLGSAATANNTINFFATVPTTGDLIDCVTSGAVCTLTDSGVLTSNVVTLTGTQTLSNKTLTAPALGTPASGVITNLTGTCTSCTSNNSAEIGGIGVTGTPSLGYIPTATSSSAATWQAPTGGGNVSNTGTPTSNQIGVWTGATTLSGSNYDPYGIRGTVDTRSDTGTYAIGGGSPNACGRVQDLAVNSALISATGDQSSSIWACGAVDFDPLLSGGGNQIFFGSGNGTVGSVYSTDIGFHSDSFLSYTGFPTTLVTGGSPTPASSGTAMVASANFPGNALTMSGTSGGATATLTSGSATSDTMLIAPGTRFIFSTGTDHTIYRVIECNVQAAPCYAISTSVIPAAQCTGTTTGCFSQFYSLAPSTGITISFVPNLASSPSTTGVTLLAPIMEIGDALGVNAASQTGGTGCGNCNTSLTAAQISNIALSAGAAGGAATCAENIFGQENSWFQNIYITNCAIGMIWEGPGAGGASTVHSGPIRNVNINYNGSWSGEWGTTQPIIPMEIDGGEEEFDRFTINDVNIGSGGVGASQLVYGSLHITNAPGSNYGHGGNITFNELHIEGCVNTVCGSSTVASGQQDAVLIDTLSGNGRPASVTGSVIISNYNLCPGTHSCVNGVHVASTFQGSLMLSGVNCLGPQSTTQGTTNIIKDDINGNTMTCANNLGGSGFYNIDAAGTAFTSFNCTDMTLGWCLYNGTWAYYSAGVATTKLTSGQIALSGTTHGITIPAGTASSGASGSVVFASDATNGYAEVNENNNGLSRVCTASNGICSVSTYSGVSPIAVTGTAISLQNSTPANVTTAYGTDTAYFTGSGGATTSGHSIIGDANGGIEDSGSVNVTPSSTTTFTNKSIAGSEINSGLVASTVGGTGVNNSATLTLGTSNRNYATLGTGFEYNTTTTGAVTDATAANLGSLINIAQYDVLLSGGTSAAPVGVAPSSTSGLPFLSQGSSANGTFAALALSGLATQTANTVVANVTGSTAAPTAASIPSGIQNYVAGTGYNQGTAHQIQVPAACGDTSASGTAQSCNTSPTFTPATSDCVTYTTTTANTGTGLTVNINSLGVKSVAIPGASGWTTTLTPSIIPNNTPLLLCYTGTNWNVQQTGTVASSGVTAFSGTGIFTNSGSVGAVTLAQSGTSGGIPYFSNSSTLSTSAVFAANALVIGGGAGTAPSTTTTGTGVLTALGTNTGSAGAFVVNGGALGTPSGGTLTNATGYLENELTGASAAGTITEGGSTFSVTRAGVSTANLTAPWVFTNANSTNNNTSFVAGFSASGSSTGQTVVNLNQATTGGDILDWGTGGSYSAGVLSGQTISGSILENGSVQTKGTTAGFSALTQGTTSAAVAPCNAANTICFQAPTAVTSQLRVLAGAPATGFPLFTNSSGTMTETISATSGTLTSGVGAWGNSAINTVLASTVANVAGHFTNLQVVTALFNTCTTAPIFNVFDGTSNTGSTVTAAGSTQTKGTGTSTAQTQTFAAGDIIGIYISSAGGTCTTDQYTVTAQYSIP